VRLRRLFPGFDLGGLAGAATDNNAVAEGAFDQGGMHPAGKFAGSAL
jgi:hypothetical protein